MYYTFLLIFFFLFFFYKIFVHFTFYLNIQLIIDIFFKQITLGRLRDQKKI